MIFYTRDPVSNEDPNDNSLIPANFPISSPDDSFFEDLLRVARTRTHTHTCNPPGPDDDGPNSKERSNLKPRRSSGNREAVRKYREKKKAHTAFLEEEVKKLRVMNQQLVSKLHGQSVLENEVLRLRSVLKDIKGKIEEELGVFNFQKQFKEMTLPENDRVLQSTGAGGLNSSFLTELSCLRSQLRSPSPAIDHFSDGGKPRVSGERDDRKS